MAIVRLFSPPDVDAVMGIVRTALKENYPPSLYLDLFHWWREGFMVAENSVRIVGFVASVMPAPGQARILMLAVDEPHRSQGVGSQLIGAFLRECAMKGLRTVELEVRQSNKRAISFYRRHGFEVSYSLERFYTDGEDGFKMVRHF